MTGGQAAVDAAIERLVRTAVDQIHGDPGEPIADQLAEAVSVHGAARLSLLLAVKSAPAVEDAAAKRRADGDTTASRESVLDSYGRVLLDGVPAGGMAHHLAHAAEVPPVAAGCGLCDGTATAGPDTWTGLLLAVYVAAVIELAGTTVGVIR